MSCPNCNQEMHIVNLDNQIILHCVNCGGSFFEQNSINRISSESAFKLSQDKTSDEVSGQAKFCPKDKTLLNGMQNDQSIPSEVTLLQCSKCKGVFVYPDDLMKFKKAQEAKISYFKIWNLPLPSIRAIVVLSFIAFISAAAFSRLVFFQSGSAPTQASNVVKKVYVSSSGRYVFISFKTELPFRSEIVFKKQNGTEVKKQISAKKTTLHYITITDISLSESTTYHIILADDLGKTIQTEEQKLELQKSF